MKRDRQKLWEFDTNPKNRVRRRPKRADATPAYGNRVYLANSQDPEHGRRRALYAIDATKRNDITERPSLALRQDPPLDFHRGHQDGSCRRLAATFCSTQHRALPCTTCSPGMGFPAGVDGKVYSATRTASRRVAGREGAEGHRRDEHGSAVYSSVVPARNRFRDEP